MKQLSKAIISKYKLSTSSGTLYSSLTGGLWNSEAPANTAYPYAVFYLISDTPSHVMEGTFTDYKYEECLVQFSIYDDDTSQATIGGLYDTLTDLYDEASLSVSGYSTISFKREFSHAEKINLENESYWQYVVQYRGLFERST
jgi:hypothetical protein